VGLKLASVGRSRVIELYWEKIGEKRMFLDVGVSWAETGMGSEPFG